MFPVTFLLHPLTVGHIAPPAPFTIALFCSWACSMAMFEDLAFSFSNGKGSKQKADTSMPHLAN